MKRDMMRLCRAAACLLCACLLLGACAAPASPGGNGSAASPAGSDGIGADASVSPAGSDGTGADASASASGSDGTGVEAAATPVVTSPASIGTESTPAAMDRLIWSDEFDGADGTGPDPEKWVRETGNNRGWGNRELQYYTDSKDNAFMRDGSLVIRAVREEKEGFAYTSARLKTQGRFDFLYGRVEMRAKLAQGKGLWPAFWMLGADIDTVPWPNCGEIYIMEHLGRTPGVIHGTLHGPEYYGGKGISNSLTTADDLYDTFHTYAVEWDETGIRWFFDGEPYHKVVKAKLPTTYTWAFDKPEFLLVNLAVGGNWPQNPDETTQFPQEYVIDYIRVYQ